MANALMAGIAPTVAVRLRERWLPQNTSAISYMQVGEKQTSLWVVHREDEAAHYAGVRIFQPTLVRRRNKVAVACKCSEELYGSNRQTLEGLQADE